MAQMPVKPLIRLVDDEVDQLAALEMLLVGQGWDVAAYTGDTHEKEYRREEHDERLVDHTRLIEHFEK